MPAAFDSAICLQHWDWSETSQVVALFTRSHGVVRALAKGSKRPSHPFSGGLEALTLGEAGLIHKAGRDLDLLTEWDLRDSLSHFRRGIRAWHAGLYIVDLIRLMVIDRDPHTALFDSSVAALRSLAGKPGAEPGVVLRFEWAILEEAGYRPEMRRDVRTGEAVGPTAPLLFDATLGGITASHSASAMGGLWGVSAQTVQILRALADDRDAPHRAPREAVEKAAKLLAAYIAWLLGRWPVTAHTVFEGLPDLRQGAISHTGNSRTPHRVAGDPVR